jgi:hypothetical protein
MKEFRVKSFGELCETLDRYKKSNLWLFRGQSDVNWSLIPKAGRESYKRADDKTFFMSWKRRAKQFIPLNIDNDWDWLAIAQHHGLVTRLLDWSINPLIAAYFATEEYYNEDAAVYAYYGSKYVIPENIEPFECKEVLRFKPNGISQRIIRQNGIFTVHASPTLPFEKAIDETETLEKIIIDKSYRKDLIFDLSFYGINKASLFPDIDGLSSHINWFIENIDYWSSQKTNEEVAADIFGNK